MTITNTIATDLDAQVGAYADRLFETGLAALEAVTISLGRLPGLYEHLATDSGLTPLSLSIGPASTPGTRRSGSSSKPQPGSLRRDQPDARRRRAPFRALGRRPGVLAPPREPRSARAPVRSAPGDQPRAPGQRVPRVPHRRGHPVCRLRAPRRTGRLQPARLRQPPGLGLADASAGPCRSSPPSRRPRCGDRLRRGMGGDLIGQGVPRASGSTASTTTKRPSRPPGSTPPKPV